MAIHGDNRSSDGAPQYVMIPRRPAFGMKGLAGVAALAAALGTGAYLVTLELLDGSGATVAEDGGAPVEALPAPVVTSRAATPSPAEPTSAAPTSATAKPSASHTRADESQVRREINAARARAAADGVPLMPALTPERDLVDVVESVSIEKTTEGSIRIGTARGDLTGQGLRLIAADDGEPAGDDGVRCTQRVRFSGKAAIRTMPTTLLCWRTSRDRSVVTLAVAAHGRPSTAISLGVINREWVKLG